MALTAGQALALHLHQQLDHTLAARRNGRFISGYDTTHPFVRAYLGDIGARNGLERDASQYNFAQDQDELIRSIQAFHRVTDHVEYRGDEILVSAGSSPLILSILTWISQRGLDAVHYFRPLYHAFYFWSNVLKLPLLPLAEEPLWDDRAEFNLPERQRVLLLTDPVWFAGRAVGLSTIEALRRWQERTDSVVIVDGTFQYLSWAWPLRCERSATLIRERTIRLVCPTKSLALHGIRYAYLLGPANILRTLRWICDNVTGSASAVDLWLARRIMQVLAGPDGNRDLVAHIAARYRLLLDTGFIREPVREPECGYYIFGKLGRAAPEDLLMNGSYFEVDGHRDYVRVNVLSPDIA